MQLTTYNEIMEALCSFLPYASITIVSPKGEVVRCIPSDQPLSLPPKMQPLYYDQIMHAYLQIIPLPQGRTLLIRDSASSHELAKERSEMANSIVTLLLSQQQSAAVSEDKFSTMALLADRLFHITTADSATFLALWAGEIGFDLFLPRAICVFNLPSAEHSPALQSSLMRMIQSSLSTHHFAGETIKNSENTPHQNIIAPLGNHQIVLLKVVPDAHSNLRTLLYPYLSSVCAMLMDQFNLPVQVGIGSVPEALYEYGISLKEAQTAIKYARLFETRQTINFIGDFSFEEEITRLPKELLDHFLEPYIRRITSPQLIETIYALIRCNMDITQTANMLYVHRNTVLFRLDQIKRLLNLNPLHNDNDRFMLHMLYAYYKLYCADKP